MKTTLLTNKQLTLLFYPNRVRPADSQLIPDAAALNPAPSKAKTLSESV